MKPRLGVWVFQFGKLARVWITSSIFSNPLLNMEVWFMRAIVPFITKDLSYSLISVKDILFFHKLVFLCWTVIIKTRLFYAWLLEKGHDLLLSSHFVLKQKIRICLAHEHDFIYFKTYYYFHSFMIWHFQSWSPTSPGF